MFGCACALANHLLYAIVIVSQYFVMLIASEALFIKVTCNYSLAKVLRLCLGTVSVLQSFSL